MVLSSFRSSPRYEHFWHVVTFHHDSSRRNEMISRTGNSEENKLVALTSSPPLLVHSFSSLAPRTWSSSIPWVWPRWSLHPRCSLACTGWLLVSVRDSLSRSVWLRYQATSSYLSFIIKPGDNLDSICHFFVIFSQFSRNLYWAEGCYVLSLSNSQTTNMNPNRQMGRLSLHRRNKLTKFVSLTRELANIL